SGSDENVDRHARVRQLAVVAAVRDSAAAAGWEVGGAGHVRGTGQLHPARGGKRRIGVQLRQRDSDCDTVNNFNGSGFATKTQRHEVFWYAAFYPSVVFVASCLRGEPSISGGSRCPERSRARNF